MSNHMAIGRTESMEAFHTWKERDEESTYSMCVKDQRPYTPKAMEGDVYGSNDRCIAINVKVCLTCVLELLPDTTMYASVMESMQRE